MSSIKQNLVQYSNVSMKPKGSSNTTNLQKAFPGSPIYQGEITDEERLESYQAILNSESLSGYGVVNFNMNYVGAPELQDVETGGEGLPATPYIPNPTSPGAGSYLASDQAEFDGEIKDVSTVSNFGSGLGGLVSPSTTSNSISRTKIGEYVSGRSYQGSDGKV